MEIKNENDKSNYKCSFSIVSKQPRIFLKTEIQLKIKMI